MVRVESHIHYPSWRNTEENTTDNAKINPEPFRYRQRSDNPHVESRVRNQIENQEAKESQLMLPTKKKGVRQRTVQRNHVPFLPLLIRTRRGGRELILTHAVLQILDELVYNRYSQPLKTNLVVRISKTYQARKDKIRKT